MSLDEFLVCSNRSFSHKHFIKMAARLAQTNDNRYNNNQKKRQTKFMFQLCSKVNWRAFFSYGWILSSVLSWFLVTFFFEYMQIFNVDSFVFEWIVRDHLLCFVDREIFSAKAKIQQINVNMCASKRKKCSLFVLFGVCVSALFSIAAFFLAKYVMCEGFRLDFWIICRYFSCIFQFFFIIIV